MRSPVAAVTIENVEEITTLYRPVGKEELDLIVENGYLAFPPRLPEQPIFSPVITEEYAVQIARDWNSLREGVGYVTRFQVQTNYLKNHELHTVGGSEHQEYWIPAERLADFNRSIVGKIEIIREFRRGAEVV